MFGEDHELLTRGGLWRRNLFRCVGSAGLRDPAGERGGGENLAQQTRQLPPLGVVAPVQHLAGAPLELAQRFDLRPQLRARPRGRGPVENLDLHRLGLLLGNVLQVFQIGGVQLGLGEQVRRTDGAALEDLLHLRQPVPEPLPPSAQGPVDRRGRRRETTLQDRQREADGRSLPALQPVGAIELPPDVVGDRVVQRRLGRRELVGDRVRPSHREERGAVELEELLLHHPPHQVGGVGAVDRGPEATFEPVPVEQRHEELEVVLLAVVGRRRHEQEVPREATEELPQPIALRVLDLPPEIGGRHLVGLVAHHEIPAAVGRLKQLLHLLVAGEHVEARDHEVVPLEPVFRPGRLKRLAGVDDERELESSVELILPLFGQTAGADHEATPEVASGDQLLHEETGHDGLAAARVVGEEKAEGLAGQHGLVDRSDLVGKGLDQGGVNREKGIEEVGETDALGLGDEAEEAAVSVEAPGARLGDGLERGFVGPVEDPGPHAALRDPVGDLDGVRAQPLGGDHRCRSLWIDAAHLGMGLKVFELH